ncbi:MAG: hypothetical protein ACXWCY_05045 [Burkholderiales bacterium]
MSLQATDPATTSDAAGFRRMFAPRKLTPGVFFPIESTAILPKLKSAQAAESTPQPAHA